MIVAMLSSTITSLPVTFFEEHRHEEKLSSLELASLVLGSYYLFHTSTNHQLLQFPLVIKLLINCQNCISGNRLMKLLTVFLQTVF